MFNGLFCNMLLDCNENNGDCDQLNCKTINVNGEHYSECVCDKGKYRTKQWTCECKYFLNCC